MEWNTPELMPFIDGRADIFAYNGALDDHRRITTMDKPLEILDKYGIEHALLRPNRSLTYLLEHESGWRSIYPDKVAVLVERVPIVILSFFGASGTQLPGFSRTLRLTFSRGSFGTRLDRLQSSSPW